MWNMIEQTMRRLGVALGRRAIAGGLASGLAAAAGARYAVLCYAEDPSAAAPPTAAVEKLAFKSAFGGQFTAPRPEAGAATTATGGVAYASGIAWQRGAFSSWWLRLGVGPYAEMPTIATLNVALDAVLARASATGGNVHAGTAVYVGLPELAADPDTIRTLYARGFRYHHYHAASSADKAEHVYYKWAGDPKDDLVPAYATSAEGVSAVLLSPDESKVLLVWENKKWKAVSGHVDAGELSVRSAERELSEEVGATVDPSFSPVLVGGFISSKNKDQNINNNFHAYILRAASESIQPDAAEISEARWLDRAALREAWEGAGKPTGSKAFEVPASLGLPEKQRRVMGDVAAVLNKYESGQGLVCSISGDRAKGKEKMMF